MTLSADGSDTTLGSMSGTTDADGVFQTTLESTLAQTETVTVAAGDAQQTASVSFSPTLAFADANIGYTSAPVEGFAIGGLDADDNGTVTFSDGNPADNQVIAITNGVASTSTVDLSGMTDGPVTASLSVSDAAGNNFTANAGATLDRDAGKQAALSLAIPSGQFSAGPI